MGPPLWRPVRQWRGCCPAGAAHASPSRGPADLIIHNGRVLLLDKHFRKAQAVAIRGGRILAVGSEREIDRFKGRRTELLDAGGGTVLPGINDSHNHVASLGLSVPPYNLGVDTDTIEELVAVIRKAAEEAPSSDSWIRGRGWQELRLPRAPVAADIDPVSGDHPVVLNDFSGHAVSVNSVVMRLAASPVTPSHRPAASSTRTRTASPRACSARPRRVW